ncbi:helix-turn-helix transcriptional regulator [Hymenobacter cellulosivorans]|uniref:LuxR C-terminal-related transcriptional regulator n=1 Tax=Hymenobacter cellulosivorans TaxID=2932249 RepID=A0ABY4FE70_9BACT|nr:LuxR C-terminal-related transcriptional regulator [Hymenobacter cellulosivorans]UOQ54840.1 LuxR C-terminal-related transcriptional regulator [Hymenobacter cellulosivorans]
MALSPTYLRPAELQCLQQAILLVYATEAGPVFTRLAQATAAALSAEIVSIDGFDQTSSMVNLGYYPAQRFSLPDFETLRQLLPEHPLFQSLIIERRPEALRTSDFRPTQKFRNSTLYQEFYQPTGLPLRELIVGLPVVEYGWITCTLNRAGREFSEADRYLLTLLVPHFQQAVRQAQTVASPPALPPNSPLLLNHLTPREAELLGYLRQGLSDKEISRCLSISPRTVQNHLQNIYVKLEVDNRTAALCKVLGVAG